MNSFSLHHRFPRKLIVSLSSVLLGVALTGQSMAADVTLRVTLQLPLKSHLGQNMVLFEKEVEEKSGGAIDVEIYDSATLYKDKEVPAAVGSGSIEMGVVSLTRYVGDVPAVDIFYQPFLFDTEAKVRSAVAKGSTVRAPLDAAIAETGSTVLWWQAYGGAVLLSKEEPVKTPADMVGKKVRVFGKTLGDFVTATGGAPTLVSGSEQYLAYQRGTVDLGMTGVSGVASRKLWEVMDTITITNHADIEFIVVVNTDFWNELSEEHKEIIAAAGLVAEADVRDRMTSIEADAYSLAEENGMTLYTPTAEEVSEWRAASEPVYEAFTEQAGDLGATVLNAAKAL
ncbi:TRAP transporter substrate-binding protein DctP [Granulosicoccus antarcticus]|uniref:C4-dicarboxylate-binding periplasmic protein DctP n=1 Tax=Granulosicoccus antarcticus IMCC3135 TaxID=1192854 RepID=A0A2Z2NWB1_9GAMM|nr:TRAP transporter substrate-binding protein DctP [Granulosicoccus antarcticus]ASJ73110.1 C4-dicarboxylate-binding periplasmic protein DctP [Granulosicoccus antarcticus IMCC3135]